MQQIVDNLIDETPTGRLGSPRMRRYLFYTSAITFFTSIYSYRVAETYISFLRRWPETNYGYREFLCASVFLFTFVIITALLAHICRKELQSYQRLLTFIPWGIGAASLISYWGVLSLPL